MLLQQPPARVPDGLSPRNAEIRSRRQKIPRKRPVLRQKDLSGAAHMNGDVGSVHTPIVDDLLKDDVISAETLTAPLEHQPVEIGLEPEQLGVRLQEAPSDCLCAALLRPEPEAPYLLGRPVVLASDRLTPDGLELLHGPFPLEWAKPELYRTFPGVKPILSRASLRDPRIWSRREVGEPESGGRGRPGPHAGYAECLPGPASARRRRVPGSRA